MQHYLKLKFLFQSILKQKGGNLDIIDYRIFLTQLQDKYGDIVKWNILGKKECFVFTPKHVKEIFKVDGTTPKRITLDALNMLQKKLNASTTLANRYKHHWN